MKQFLRFLSVGLILAAPLLSFRPAYAASASFSLSPASRSVAQGEILSVTIRENSDEPINAVEAHLSYPADKFDYVSISNASSFLISAKKSGGGGSVQVQLGASNSDGTPAAHTGLKSVATVRFRAKVSTGTAAITFKDESKIISASSNQNILTGKTGGNYTFKAPAPAAAASSDTIPPTITNIVVTDIKVDSATVTWTTSEPSTSEVNYGLNNGYGIAAVDSAMVTEHKVVLSSAILQPGTKYHYSVRSVDPAGNAASSNDNSFNTLGATLKIKVLNQKDKAVAKAKVTLEDKSAVTDKKGEATLTGLPLGKLVGTVEHKGKKTVVTADVKSIDPSGKPQNITFKIETKPNPLLILVIPLLALAALAAYLMRRRGGGGGTGLGGLLSGLKLPKRRNTPQPPSAAPRSQPEPSVVKPNIIRPSGPQP